MEQHVNYLQTLRKLKIQLGDKYNAVAFYVSFKYCYTKIVIKSRVLCAKFEVMRTPRNSARHTCVFQNLS
jgi:hypothetical protein